MATLALPLQGNETMTVTVHSGARHTFLGWGANHFDIDPPLSYLELPEGPRKKMIRHMWHSDDLGFKWLRIPHNAEQPVDRFRLWYSLYINDVLEVNPGMEVLYNPVGFVGDVKTYVSMHCRTMDTLKKVDNIPITYTGVSNEPNNTVHTGVELDKNEMCDLILLFRDTLDFLGLQDVKIIAPEASNTGDSWSNQAIEQITSSDCGAADKLDGYAIHSYNMGMTKGWSDWIGPMETGKELWQTESSNTLQKEVFIDSAKGAETSARFLSDVNLGVQKWLYWKGISSFTSYDNGSVVIGFNHISGEYRPFLKFYYIRKLVRTFDMGCVMRLASTSMDSVDRYKWMENWWCDAANTWSDKKPPIVLAAGLNTNGEWGIGLVNLTGIPNRENSNYFPAATYDVEIVVEELDGTGQMDFLVWRCNNSYKNVSPDADPVTFVDGKATVTIRPMEQLCLRPSFNTTFITVDDVADEEPLLGGCGTGVLAALVPPMFLKCRLAFRRRKRRSESRRR
jgi:hypothetical protein